MWPLPNTVVCDQTWLEILPAEVLLSDRVIDDGEHDAARERAEPLDARNNGELGPGRCDDGDGDGDADDHDPRP